MSERQKIYKVSFDFFFTLFCVSLLTPAILIICMLVKLTSRGPLIISEERVGKNNRRFSCYKFRTTHGSDLNRNGRIAFSYNDSVLTPVGLWLRGLGFDELPQLFNVLRGDMSLVGPRPYKELTSADEDFFLSIGQLHGMRHTVRPGITGWAQVNGYRGAPARVEMEKWHLSQRLTYDLYYINNWSIWFDLKIIFMTMTGVVAKKSLLDFTHRHGGRQRA